ncbi:MAG: ABC transporter ATP-binding protein [Thermoplasmata archaeon]
MIEVNHVSKSFGERTAVNDISFVVKEGESVVLLGPNGAGKTTTLRLLSALIKPNSGKIVYDGYPIGTIESKDMVVRKQIGFLSENSGLYENLTVLDNLLFFGELYGLDYNRIIPRINEIAEKFDIASILNTKVKKLSKGTKQRVSITRTLLHYPKYLIMDEPTSSLDPISAKKVRDIIATLKKDKVTVIMSTHNLAEAMLLSSRILFINKKILVDITKEDLDKKIINETKRAIHIVHSPIENIENIIRGEDIIEVKKLNPNETIVKIKGELDKNWEVIDALSRNHIKVYLVENYENDLENFYIKIFGEKQYGV